MSDDKQKDVLGGYEQLKRRNRRRLVTATGLVAVSGVILAAVLNGGSDSKPAGQTVTINNQAASAASMPAGEPAPQVEMLQPQSAAASMPAGSDVPAVTINNDRLDDSDINVQPASGAASQTAQAKPSETVQTAQTSAAQETEPYVGTEAPPAADEHDVGEDDAAAQAAAAAQRAKAREAEQRAERRRAAERKAAAERKQAQEKIRQEIAKRKKQQAEKAAAATEKKRIQADAAEERAAKLLQAERVKDIDTQKDKTAWKKADKPAEKPAKTAAAPVAKGKRAVILAGYPEKERALSLQRKMKAAGIQAGIIEINTDKGKVYRVKSGKYPNRAAAERDLNKLRVHGIAGQVIDE
ncbi:SPOR domain-containing protein [Neisseria chenwenguii]|uniref:SPOR domain-containing protein n=1 Tax=Neisseria chenwenguii TaxID=1853278 RepID=UPI000F4E2444|nr:SPOR domain-containing protein [Neisseria chenwenguii]ROV57269.1 cell division protein FtsN [Neisseria chenwenguii]